MLQALRLRSTSQAHFGPHHCPGGRRSAAPTPLLRAPVRSPAAAAAGDDGTARSEKPSAPSPQLVAAAQQLARASVQHLQLELLAPCNQAVSELMRVAEAAEEGRDVVQVLHSDFQLVLEQLVAMQAGAARQESQTRIATTQWAWDHAERGQFEYWIAPPAAGAAAAVAASGGSMDASSSLFAHPTCAAGLQGCRQAMSADFVRQVLEAFLVGEEGAPIPDAFFIPISLHNRSCQGDRQQQATSAPAASAINTPPQPQVSKEPIGLGSFVTIAPHFRNLTHAVHGPLKEGRYGVVVKTDHTSMPYKVRDLVSGREWWYETTAVLAVSKEEAQGFRPPAADNTAAAAAASGPPKFATAELFSPFFDIDASELERQSFRDALVRQLHMLTGVKPRVVDQGKRKKGAQYWLYRQ